MKLPSIDATIILTCETQDPFSRVPKALLDDNRLTWKAKGIMAYLLGKPSGWKVRVNDLKAKGQDGCTSVRSGLNELRKTGYASLEAVREKGKIVDWIYRVSDQPIFGRNDQPLTAKTRATPPETGTTTPPSVDTTTPPSEQNAPDDENLKVVEMPIKQWKSKADEEQEAEKANVSPDSGFPDVENRRLSKKEKIARKSKIKAPATSEGVATAFPKALDTETFRELWIEWRAHRKAQRRALTPQTERKQLAELEQCEALVLGYAVRTVEHALKHGWQGLFPTKADEAAMKIAESARTKTKTQGKSWAEGLTA